MKWISILFYLHHIRCRIKYNIIVADNLQCNHFRDCQKVIIYICEQVNCKQIYLPVIFKINAKPKRNNLEFILTKLPYTSYHIRFENAMVQFTNAYVAITPFFGNGNKFILVIHTILKTIADAIVFRRCFIVTIYAC